jgi:L-ascorbate metabolism protein UlaG (beta-lactamase superfamily)
MIEPALSDDALLAEIEAAPKEDDELRVWWLGQSGFLVRINDARVLLDPYLSDSLTRKYAGTDKPHVRMTRRVLAPERLTGISAVTSSHMHTDHCDAETLRSLLAANPGMKIIVPEANRTAVAERVNVAADSLIGLDDGMSVTVAPFEFHAIAAAHNDLARDTDGHHLYLGFVVRCGGWTIYHSGDTLRYDGLTEKLRRFSIDVALLPINGDRPERRVAGNLDGAQAAQLAHDMGARCVIPCHYDMFEFNTADPEKLFVPACERLHQPFAVLRSGDAWSATKLRSKK